MMANYTLRILGRLVGSGQGGPANHSVVGQLSHPDSAADMQERGNCANTSSGQAANARRILGASEYRKRFPADAGVKVSRNAPERRSVAMKLRPGAFRLQNYWISQPEPTFLGPASSLVVLGTGTGT